MKRMPRIKFPQRHPKPLSGSTPPPQTSSSPGEAQSSFFKPAPPTDATAEGKAALHPRRTPVTDKEIETVMLGGNF